MLARIGRAVLRSFDEFLYGLGFFARVFAEALRLAFRRKVGRRVLVYQILFTGIEALGITAVMALAIGAAIIGIGHSLPVDFVKSQLMYSILIIVIAKELGPLLTAFIIIARSGTAIATELGGMVVSHEIEAYVAVGVDPIEYLAAPRFLGVVVSMITLYVYFNVFGLLGSFVVVRLFLDIGVSEYFTSLFAALTPGDVFLGLLKCFVYGSIISVVALNRGFSVERAITEVPVAGIRAVSTGFMLCIVAEFVMLAAQYLR